MKKIWLIIIFGIILRLGLMPFTIHPDIRGHYLGGLLIAKEGQFLVSMITLVACLETIFWPNYMATISWSIPLSLIGPMLCL